MIEFVTGKLNDIDTEYIVIDVNGIGYLVFCANPFSFQKQQGETLTVYTYQHVREDAIKLFGFHNRSERRLFEKLLQVSGIGPKGALAILASGAPERVVQAIEEEDERFLVQFPGVGKKTARQIILDLKGKLPEWMPSLLDKNGDPVPESAYQKEDSSKELDEAVEALKALGYVDREIKRALPKLQEKDLTTDGYIKEALRLMLKV
ncbi:Holliday junction branch migration protein RuvA [Alteribacter natronophilus]|uniref:Holliday junction branch migration protein RuvA n=1 Tax=Alteribacter natronophilus TaxID=2583810 RepID=UPI00110DC0FF|nr:Holliday junction branch migration protein RuvA [Alteribacter natronophilus]TMW73979.1 Holliday junction branch migration protein RuvA [Alteribacter natronophilus]